jgi:hypothetical protein
VKQRVAITQAGEHGLDFVLAQDFDLRLLHARRVHQRCRILGNKPPLGSVTECAAQAAVNVTGSPSSKMPLFTRLIIERPAAEQTNDWHRRLLRICSRRSDDRGSGK